MSKAAPGYRVVRLAHIGGDETVALAWTWVAACKAAQKLMAAWPERVYVVRRVEALEACE